MAFRPFYEIKNIFGSVIGKDLNGNPDERARDWVMNNTNPLSFNGSLAHLEALISSQADSCGSTIKQYGTFTSQNTARDLCKTYLEQAYAENRFHLQGESANNDRLALDQFFNGNRNILILGIAAIIIVYIILYR